MSVDLLHLGAVVSAVSGLLGGGWLAARRQRRRHAGVVVRSWMVEMTIAATARRVALSSLEPGSSEADREHARKLLDALLRFGLAALPASSAEPASAPRVIETSIDRRPRRKSRRRRDRPQRAP